MMKYALVILLAACGMQMASTMFLQRERKAVSNSPAQNSTILCAPSTPCGWSIYNPKNNLIIEENIENSYCRCDVGLDCVITQDDQASKSFIYHCRPPKPDSENN